MSIRIEEKIGSLYSRGPQVVRVLHDFIIPAIPVAFRTGIESIQVAESDGAHSREAGRLERTLDGDVRIELYPDNILRKKATSLLCFDVYLGASLAHVLLPLLVRAREIRRHGMADEDVVRVAGERLAQETLATAFRDHNSLAYGFAFRALEPILLDEKACRSAKAYSLLRIPAMVLGAMVHVRSALFFMMADLLQRFSWTFENASSVGEEGSPLTLVGLVFHPAAAYVLAVYLLHDFITRLRSGRRYPLALGPVFGALWPLGLVVSYVTLPLDHPILFGDLIQSIVQAYILMAYSVLGLKWFLHRTSQLPNCV